MMLIDDFLVEGRGDYEAMFRGIFASPEIPEDYKQWIRARINWAKQVLKKSDRVVWFLRYIKAMTMDAFSPPETDPLPGEQWITSFDPDCLRPYQAYGYHSFMTAGFWEKLAHFMSLDCPAIQNLVFGKKPVSEIMKTLYDEEAKWAKEQQGRIASDHANNEHAETIIDFGDGWVWMNLHRPSCSEEGRSMGHCGNSPRSHSDDTILSLRKKIQKGDKLFYEPHLTFTMDENHYLMERKGRANERPQRKYFPMIVALLTHYVNGHPYVAGLTEGHWEPWNDFQVDNLDPDSRAKLIEIRPELGNAKEYWEHAGNDFIIPVLQGKIMKELNGRYAANIYIRPTEDKSRIRSSTGKYEVHCYLELPPNFKKLLQGRVVTDPFRHDLWKPSERKKKRRDRVQKLHEDEVNALVSELEQKAKEESKERFDWVVEDMTPKFRFEMSYNDVHFGNQTRQDFLVEAIASIEDFMFVLYDDPHIKEMLNDLMNGELTGVAPTFNKLKRFAESFMGGAVLQIVRAVEDLEMEDIKKYGDIEGIGAVGDDMPAEDWEIRARI